MPMEQITLEMVKPLQVGELAMEVVEPVEVVMAVAAEDSRTKPARSQPHQGPAPPGATPSGAPAGRLCGQATRHQELVGASQAPTLHRTRQRPQAAIGSAGPASSPRSQPLGGQPLGRQPPSPFPWQPFSFRPQPRGRLL